MDFSQNKIGGNIAALRKAKGLTQEQLADRLGISAPAVSKWETGSSYPDISLLCPLARALDTNVDSLLSFHEELSDREVKEQIDGVFALLTGEGTAEERSAAGEARLNELLHRYPNSEALKFNAALSYDSFALFFPGAEEEKRLAWRSRKKKLMEELYRSGSGPYRQQCAMLLANLAILEGEPDRAESLLKELPEQCTDPTGIWVQLYLKQGKPLEALKATQRSLYISLTRALSCLGTLVLPELEENFERSRKAAEAYSLLANIFGFLDSGQILMVESWLRRGEKAKAAECFESYVEKLTGEAVRPDEDLFDPGLELKKSEGINATSREIVNFFAEEIMKDQQLMELYDQPAFVRAMEKLEAERQKA